MSIRKSGRVTKSQVTPDRFEVGAPPDELWNVVPVLSRDPAKEQSGRSYR